MKMGHASSKYYKFITYAVVVVLLNAAGPDAKALFEWLQDEAAATILTRFGLTPEY